MHHHIDRGRLGVALCAAVLVLLCLCPQAFAGLPTHARVPSLDISALNKACGAAVDTKGDLYASSPGEGKVKVYDPSHVLLTEISNANEPCGLAVDSAGNLYVSEKATGNGLRYTPNA